MQQDKTIDHCADILSTIGCTKSAEQLTLITNLLALAISKGKNIDELNVIGNFLVGVGSLILTLAAQKDYCEDRVNKLKQIDDLKKQIKKIEAGLN